MGENGAGKSSTLIKVAQRGLRHRRGQLTRTAPRYSSAVRCRRARWRLPAVQEINLCANLVRRGEHLHRPGRHGRLGAANGPNCAGGKCSCTAARDGHRRIGTVRSLTRGLQSWCHSTTHRCVREGCDHGRADVQFGRQRGGQRSGSSGSSEARASRCVLTHCLESGLRASEDDFRWVLRNGRLVGESHHG